VLSLIPIRGIETNIPFDLDVLEHSQFLQSEYTTSFVSDHFGMLEYRKQEAISSMSFCTVINCMDGRVQLPVIAFLMERFRCLYVDIVSEPGPSLILSERSSRGIMDSILRRVDISFEVHKSKGVAIVAHADCAGNPGRKSKQLKDLRNAVDFLTHRYVSTEVIALWVDEKLEVQEIASV